jgi:hypothetical protein
VGLQNTTSGALLVSDSLVVTNDPLGSCAVAVIEQAHEQLIDLCPDSLNAFDGGELITDAIANSGDDGGPI